MTAPNLETVRDMLVDALQSAECDGWNAGLGAAVGGDDLPDDSQDARGEALANRLLKWVEARAEAKPPAPLWIVFNTGCSQGCGTPDPHLCGSEAEAEALANRLNDDADLCYDQSWEIVERDAPNPHPAQPSETDAEHLAHLDKAAAEADRGDVITLTGMTRDEMLASLFGGESRPHLDDIQRTLGETVAPQTVEEDTLAARGLHFLTPSEVRPFAPQDRGG